MKLLGALKRLWPILLLVANSAVADTAYVTDTITVAVFPGSDLQGEPVERLLSGSLVDVLQSGNGVAKIKTGSGKTGWLRTDFLTTNLPTAIKLEHAESELSKTNTRLDAANKKVAELEKSQGSLKKEADEARKNAGWMKAEMNKARDKAAALKKLLTSQQADVSETGQQTKSLQQHIDSLEAEKKDLQQRLAATLMINNEAGPPPQATDPTARDFPWSAVTLVVGLLAGFAAGWYWIDRRVRRRFGGARVY
jgi:SH3 domain protein